MVGIGITSSEMDGGRPEWPRPFWPPRNWWLALLVILVLAGALRYPGYDFSLPYATLQDENTFALAGRMIIDFGSARSIGYHHYPPGIISIYYLALRLFHDPATPPASVIWVVRLINITASLGVITLLGLFGYHAVGRRAGLLGAAFWTITPLFVERVRWGTAEVFVTFFSILALYCAVVATLYRRERWSTVGTYALMLAILFKYHCAALTPVVLFLPLWHRRVSWRRVLANTGRFALFCAWLLLLTPILGSSSDSEFFTGNTNWVAQFDIENWQLLQNLRDNLRHAIAAVDWRVLAPGWLGLWLLWVEPKGLGRQRALLAFLPISGALFLWPTGLSVFGAHGGFIVSWLFAWLSLTVMISGWGYALIWRALGRHLASLSPPRAAVVKGLALIVLLALFLPSAVDSVENLRHALRVDPRNFVRDYAADTLASGRYISSRHSNLLNSSWGGYRGENHFELASFDNFTEHPIAYWHEREVDYAILHHSEYEQLLEGDPDGYLRETTRLKGWAPQPNYRYTTMVVLLLHPIQHQATGKLGPIRLIGYDLPEESAHPGQGFAFHLYWQAEAATATDYQVFNHLLDAEGNLVAQIDGPPLPDPLLRRGTSGWDDSEEILYSREYVLTLPEDLAPGEYSLVTGFYRRDSGQRLLTPTGEDSLYVTTISIE